MLKTNRTPKDVKTPVAEIVAISPIFGYGSSFDRFCVTGNVAAALTQLGQRIAGTPALVALYAVQNNEPDYNPDPAQYGRVIALVRALPMPVGCDVWSYPSGCPEFKMSTGLVDRWPAGWPSEVVFYSEHGGPFLKDAVAFALHRHDFGAFTHQLLRGPIDLRQHAMKPLRDHLMVQIRHQIARDPRAQVRPF
jgi:hypothetical protein